MLSLLALYAVALRSAAGWDLRARCALLPKDDLRLAVVGPKTERTDFTLAAGEAAGLFAEAVSAVGIKDRSVQLKAGGYLNDLVDKAVASE